jgi:hypothetical protein
MISSDFTIEDIHKIREWNYECLKDASVQERLEEIRRQAAPGIKTIENLRNRTRLSPAGVNTIQEAGSPNA